MPTFSGMNRTLSLVIKICQAMSTMASLSLASVLLISCTSTAQNSSPAEELAEDEKTSAGAEIEVLPENLPEVELTADLMYKILLADLARQRSNKELALAAIVDAAIETRDPRLAAQATRQAVISSQFATAIQMAELWQELSPNDVDAYQTLGNLLVVDKKPEQAAPYYSRALALTDKKKRNLLLTQISSTLIRYSSQQQTLDLIEDLAREYPDSVDVALAHASVASKLKQYDIATTAIDRALALEPENVDAAVFKFSLLTLQNKDSAAVDFASDFLKRHPDAILLRTALARHFLEESQLEQAEKEYLIIHKQDPTSFIAPMALALIRIDSGLLDDASDYLEKVLQLQPNNDLARVYLGDIASKQKRLDDAITWYRAVTDQDQLFTARVRLVDVIMERDGIEAALRELEGIHPESPSQSIDLILLQNELLAREGRLAESLELINEALADNPDNIELLYARAMIAAQQKDVANLEKDLLRVLEIQPGHVQSLNALGFTLADLTDRYDEAYTLIAAALKKKPGDPFILDSMGWVSYRLQNLDAAEEYLRKALAKRNDPEIASHLVEVLLAAGKLREATEILAKANKDFPGDKKLDAINAQMKGN